VTTLYFFLEKGSSYQFRELKQKNYITTLYNFHGTVDYKKHKGSRSMSITWQHENPMPAHFWERDREDVDEGMI
jgi:hypothetical protein